MRRCTVTQAWPWHARRAWAGNAGEAARLADEEEPGVGLLEVHRDAVVDVVDDRDGRDEQRAGYDETSVANGVGRVGTAQLIV